MRTKHWVYLAVHFVLLLLGSSLVVFGEGSAITNIGASLIATGMAGGVVFVYVLLSSQTAERLSMLETSGILAVHPFRSVSIRSEYEKRLAKAQDRIDIIGFGLSHLRQDFSEHFENWCSRATVRILLIDPSFPNQSGSLAGIRDTEERNPHGTIESDVRAFVAETAMLIAQNPKFEVRLYRAIPAVNYFRIDDEAFWGPYFVTTQSRNTPTFLVSRRGVLFQSLERHFDCLWTSEFSTVIPTDWL